MNNWRWEYLFAVHRNKHSNRQNQHQDNEKYKTTIKLCIDKITTKFTHEQVYRKIRTKSLPHASDQDIYSSPILLQFQQPLKIIHIRKY